MITAAGSREVHRPDTTPQRHDNPVNEELHQTNTAQTASPVPRWMSDTHIKLNTRSQVNIRDQQPPHSGYAPHFNLTRTPSHRI
jgi:hypothetical protein